MSTKSSLQTLIAALTQAHRSGQTLPSTEWINAIASEDDAYAVQDGVAAALDWVQGPLRGIGSREVPAGLALLVMRH